MVETAQDTALSAAMVRWRTYVEGHMDVAYDLWHHTGDLGANSQHVEGDMCVGWAHRELIRRGFGVSMVDCAVGDVPLQMHGARPVSPCVVYLGHGSQCDMFGAPTLLDAYLNAIEATEVSDE